MRPAGSTSSTPPAPKAGSRCRGAAPSRTRCSVQWAQRTGHTGAGRTAVVIGCALGADAEFVAGLGFTTTAFDVSPTAIQLARERHPRTAVRYVTFDLLHVPAAWQRAFDLVVEIITLQALPPELHPRAASAVRELVAGSGRCSLSGRYPTRVPCRHRGHSLAPRSKASHPAD